MCGALLLTLVGLLFAVCTDQTYGALYHALEPCPDGHKPGDFWVLPGCRAARCIKENFYTFESCGVIMLQYDRSTCYETKNSTIPYPDCCFPTVVCPGDPGYNAKNLSG
ncbi:hypothetical protein BsWGS_20178 [Bradybaena similaris]